MASSEELARYVASVQESQLEQEKLKGEGYMLPPPPKPGEYIHCRICGEIMMPEDFSDDPRVRKQEFKWQIHDKCKQKQLEMCDIQTPGLLSERQNGLRAGRNVKPHY